MERQQSNKWIISNFKSHINSDHSNEIQILSLNLENKAGNEVCMYGIKNCSENT